MASEVCVKVCGVSALKYECIQSLYVIIYRIYLKIITTSLTANGVC